MKIMIAGLLCIPLLALSTLLIVSSGGTEFPSAHPSDKQLETIFFNNEREFDRLVSMAKTDSKVIRIAKDFTWLEDNAQVPRPESELGFSVERWNEYKELFIKLNLRGGIQHYPQISMIYLIASNRGLLTGGSNKGFAYSEKELSPTYESLDQFETQNTHGKAVFKKISDKWYLYFESN